MEQRNVRLLLAYDGTEYHGWQRQPGLRTVQELLEQAVRRVARHQVAVLGAGRTDSGVHAAGQVASFLTGSTIPCDRMARAIGSRLPKDISVYHAREVPLSFRSTSDATSKLYRYRIHNHPKRPVSQHTQRYAYHFWQPLDLERMREAARLFVGTRDFAAFASRGSERETTVRTVHRVDVRRSFEEIRIDVEGSGFLYHQVRNMVGTLIEVGRGHWEPACVTEILAGGDRGNAGPTAPALGLCLQWVRYDLPRLAARPADADASASPAETSSDAPPDTAP